VEFCPTKSHMTSPGIELGPRWVASNLPPELWHGLCQEQHSGARLEARTRRKVYTKGNKTEKAIQFQRDRKGYIKRMITIASTEGRRHLRRPKKRWNKISFKPLNGVWSQSLLYQKIKKDFAEVIIHIVFFLVVTPCSLGKGDQYFAEIFCSYTKQTRDNAFLRNVRIHEAPNLYTQKRELSKIYYKKKRNKETQNRWNWTESLKKKLLSPA
jgi:hypothetical protein